MAVFNKFNQFTKDLVDGKHVFASNTFKVMLSNTAPLVTNQIKADITEISAVNGYTAGGPATTISESTTGGVAKISGSNVTVTATGPVGPFQYAVLYNDTTASPVKPLVAWWDYGSPITLANTETFTVVFDPVNGILQLS